ncbi:hypothetical protein BRARA_F01989 [Brassica rapa]|uniref:Retropepsins domain-containing protein n=1 Tax=Brassica campestris TaxID=3711 RepID=A0A397YZ48_BRACM|nr:hypothetical protein BRARA_F01989 [Brassica rapa]
MGTQIIDYDDFTYGELVSIVKQEGLRICQDLKLQKHLKWELKRTKVELGSLCKIRNRPQSRKKDTSKTTIQDIRIEIKEVKNDLKIFKEKQRQDSEYFHSIISSIKDPHDSSSEEQENDCLNNQDENLKEQIQSLDVAPNDFFFVLRITSLDMAPNDFFFVLRITSRKYKIRVTIFFSENYKIDTIALFDTGADFNCIKYGLVPKCFHLETKEKLSAANNSKLRITSKAEASILKENILIKTAFILTDDIYQNVILGTPFINLITPYKVMDDKISFKNQNIKLSFKFLETPRKRSLNLIKACSIQENFLNSLIHSKTFHLEHLKSEVLLQRP